MKDEKLRSMPAIYTNQNGSKLVVERNWINGMAHTQVWVSPHGTVYVMRWEKCSTSPTGGVWNMEE